MSVCLLWLGSPLCSVQTRACSGENCYVYAAKRIRSASRVRPSVYTLHTPRVSTALNDERTDTVNTEVRIK
jgi:hypothetical protein